MVSKRAAVIFIAVLGLALLAFGQSVSVSGSHWSYSAPEGFRRDDHRKGVPDGSIGLFGPIVQKFAVNILITSGPIRNQTATSLGKASVADARRNLSMTVHSENGTKIGGADAYTWRTSRKTSSGVVVGQRMVVLVKGGVGVVMTFSFPNSAHAEWDRAFVDSLKSFKWQ